MLSHGQTQCQGLARLSRSETQPRHLARERPYTCRPHRPCGRHNTITWSTIRKNCLGRIAHLHEVVILDPGRIRRLPQALRLIREPAFAQRPKERRLASAARQRGEVGRAADTGLAGTAVETGLAGDAGVIGVDITYAAGAGGCGIGDGRGDRGQGRCAALVPGENDLVEA